MLISDYLSSNIIIGICFFYLTHLARAEIRGRNTEIFWFIFGSNENFKICYQDLLTLFFFKISVFAIHNVNVDNLL